MHILRPLVSVASLGLLIDNDLLNRLLWCTLLLALFYVLLGRLVEKCNRRLRRQGRSANLQARLIWTLCFYLASSAFLACYHAYFIQDDLTREEGGHYFPQYHHQSILFFRSADRNRYHFLTIFTTSLSYHLLAILEHLRELEYTEAVSRSLFVCLLCALYRSGFEVRVNGMRSDCPAAANKFPLPLQHFFILLHVTIGLYQALTSSLLIVAASNQNCGGSWLWNGCAGLHFLSWSYVFLNRLPFHYLLPTLYVRDYVWLNVACFAWYGACVWNSPLLSIVYHQTFHCGANRDDCLGE